MAAQIPDEQLATNIVFLLIKMQNSLSRTYPPTYKLMKPQIKSPIVKTSNEESFQHKKSQITKMLHVSQQLV